MNKKYTLADYNKAVKRVNKDWDFYFGKTPLSNPEINNPHMQKVNRDKLLISIKNKENIENELNKNRKSRIYKI